MKNKNNKNELDDVCEECKKKSESVSQNLIMYGYKILNLAESQKLFFLFS